MTLLGKELNLNLLVFCSHTASLKIQISRVQNFGKYSIKFGISKVQDSSTFHLSPMIWFSQLLYAP